MRISAQTQCELDMIIVINMTMVQTNYIHITSFQKLFALSTFHEGIEFTALSDCTKGKLLICNFFFASCSKNDEHK